jgi:hypothetical protein
MQVADAELAAKDAPPKDSPQADPWYNQIARLRGRADFDGFEYAESQIVLDHLQIPMHARRAGLFRRLTALMRAHNWEPIRIKRNGCDGGGVTERIRGYRRKTDRLPNPQASAGIAGNSASDFVMTHVIGRLEQDSRWQLAASVRKLLAERNELKEKLAAFDDRNASPRS